MASDWRKELGFAKRLAATSKMQVSAFGNSAATRGQPCLGMEDPYTDISASAAAYKAANPGNSASEATKHAKSVEESARKHASSTHDYHGRCAKAAAKLLSRPVEAHKEPEPSRDPTRPVLPRTGVRIGRYDDAQHYKDGVFSEIWRAKRAADDRDSTTSNSIVALKITVPSSMQAPHDAVREARILGIARHDHVITLLETFQQSGGRFVLAFPFMAYDLDALLSRRVLTDTSRRKILSDLFTGLTHVHSLGIIHRDIKPSNILLNSAAGPAYIADFGIAWCASDPASEAANEKILDVGTTCYRPPELLFGKTTYDTTLDLWAAGCVAAQVVCLNGRTLFDAGDLGSELALIKNIFETLGTPNLATWPEAADLPDWGKMNFREYSSNSWDEIIPGTDQEAISLVKSLVVYESGDRLSAEDALKHPYLS